jgi:hypothetical protein
MLCERFGSKKNSLDPSAWEQVEERVCGGLCYFSSQTFHIHTAVT